MSILLDTVGALVVGLGMNVLCKLMLVARELELLCAVSKRLAVVLDSRTWKMPKHDFVIPRLALSTLPRLQDPEISHSASFLACGYEK